MTLRLRLLAVWTLGVVALAACSSGGSPSQAASEPVASASEAATAEPTATPIEMTSVDFRLNWVISGNHAPYFLAKQEGYWSDCGLDVSLAAGQGSGDTAQLVANGSQEFGLTDAVSIAAGRVKGLPVTSLGVIYQSNPSSIVSYKDAGITQLSDVEGKTWGAVPGGSPYLLLQALFELNNITDVREVSVPAPGIAQLKAGQVDFITFFGNEAANIDSNPAGNLNVIPFKDYGQDIYGLAIASSDDYIASHPDQVRCFVEGVRKGFEAAAGFLGPQAALDALYAAAPETKDRPDVMQALLDGAFEYAGDNLLNQTAEKWDATQTTLADAGIIDGTLDPTEFFTNDYQ